jgi:subtilisin family serine protease
LERRLLSLTVLLLVATTLSNAPETVSNQKFALIFDYEDHASGPISVFVESLGSLGPQEIHLLNEFGAVTTAIGSVAVLHTRFENLQTIARLPFVSSLEHSWPLHTYLDKSVPDIGADVVWDEVLDSLDRNVTGEGVIIGFVDTGIDVYHPDFSFPNGTTKIAYVWDQTTPGHPPAGFHYGNECTSDDIQTHNCSESDTFGHGTHVAGIAAGSGRATGNYTGVAPGASIVFVKSGYSICQGSGWTFDPAQILDGVSYIVAKASQLGERAVVNLSLGGNIGGHDGSDPMEVALDEFVKKGTPIVVAAGNSAQDDTHISGQLAKDGNVTFQIDVLESTTNLGIDVWYSPLDQIDATLTVPDGATFTIPVPTTNLSENYGNLTTVGTTSALGRELYFEANSLTQLPTEGWSVTLRAHQIYSKGTWDAWVDTSSCSVPGASFLPGRGYEIDPNDTIGIPGTAHYVVTVGAYITKTFWKGLNEQDYGSNIGAVGGIARFGSLGPTRDLRVKPDIIAPGAFIASARTSAISSKPSDPDSFHRVLAGTSMAASHVAGTIALMLQYSPDLQAIQVAKILSDTARQDDHTGLLLVGASDWGFGKLDARAATGLMRLTLLVRGLPIGEKASIHIGNSSLEVSTGSWANLYFPLNTTHTVAVQELLNTDIKAQYQLVDAQSILRRRSLNIQSGPTERTELRVAMNQSETLVLNYEAVPTVPVPPTPPNTSVLVLPTVAFLVLIIAAISLAYRLLRRKIASAGS